MKNTRLTYEGRISQVNGVNIKSLRGVDMGTLKSTIMQQVLVLSTYNDSTTIQSNNRSNLNKDHLKQIFKMQRTDNAPAVSQKHILDKFNLKFGHDKSNAK